MLILQDVGVAIQGGHPGIELIDIIFAYSNVKLVRELVEDQIRQLEETGPGKGQAEGLKNMIMTKQKALHASLAEVEKMLEGIIDASSAMGMPGASMRNVRLNPEQTKAMVGAIVFAINHMAKFVPDASPGGNIGLPESMF